MNKIKPPDENSEFHSIKSVTMPEELKDWQPYCHDCLSAEVWKMRLDSDPFGRNISSNSNAIQSIIGYLADLTKKACELEKEIKAIKGCVSPSAKPSRGHDE